MKFSIFILMMIVVVSGCQEEELRDKIGDTAPSDRWIYDDWTAAKEQAETKKKPIMAIFRCVP